uniref:ZP domain-containing protein n=1 Tax=Caenorhabditis japonica TaxID=281687 RepID=A0A8R1I3N0_CAEJA
MASISAVLSLVLLVGLGTNAFKSTTHIHHFHVEEYSEDRFTFNPNSFYGLFGPDEHICLNLTTSSPVDVLFGSCNQVNSLGRLDSGIIAINKSFVDLAMETARLDQNCKIHSLNMEIRTLENHSKGHFSMFTCYGQRTRTIPSRRTPKIIESVSYKPVPTTWNDKYQQFPFKVVGGDVIVRKLDMRAMIDAASVDRDTTVCFSLQGTTRARVTLSRCQNSEDIRVNVNDEKVAGLDLEDTTAMLKLLHYSCPMEKKSHHWYLSIETNDEKVKSGLLSVYTCKKVIKNSRLRFDNSAKVMGLTRQYFFAVRRFSEGTYSADLKNLLDVVTYDKNSRLKIRVDLETTSLTSVVVSRCKTLSSSSNHYRVIDWSESDTFDLNYEEVMILQELTMSAKCEGEFETDDALYLHILSRSDEAFGSVTFALDYAPYIEKEIQMVRKDVPFHVAKDSIILKSVAVEKIFDEGLMSSRLMGIELKTTNNVSLYISKCAYSVRQAIGLNIGSGLHQLRHNHQVALFRLFNDQKCSGQDGDNHAFGYLHVEGLKENTEGFVRFVSLHNGTRYPQRMFVKLNDSVATRDTAELNIYYNKSVSEFDLQYFVEAIRSTPELRLSSEHNSSEPLTVIFHKCANVSDENMENGYQITLSNLHVFTLEEVDNIRTITKSRRCDNKSQYGIFAVVKNRQFDGKISFSIGKYGRKLLRNEYILRRG